MGTLAVAPVLKWAGSKRKEAPAILPHLQARMNPESVYWEPFAGSAAVFFALRPRVAVLNDILPEIGTLYRALHFAPARVGYALQELLSRGVDEVEYLRVRRWKPLEIHQAAARVIYLNRVGFNGLWRTNGDGEFNVPFGDGTAKQMPTMAHLKRAGALLQRALILTGNWTVPVRSMEPGDVAFIDPPYPGTFQGYAGDGEPFDERSLAREMKRQWERGCHFVVTLPDSEVFRSETEGWCDRLNLERTTTIGQKDSGTLRQMLWATRIRA